MAYLVCFYCLFVCFAVVTSEYNRIITFKEPIKGKVLKGHVIRSLKVANEGSCPCAVLHGAKLCVNQCRTSTERKKAYVN